ncbi:MAG: hypothetical protein ACI35W_04485 [Anaeroplasmataceae bacterium]
MKKIWKYLKMLPIIVYPYLYMLAILVVFVVAIIEDSTTQSYDYTMLAMVMSILLALVITVLCLILSIFNSIRSGINAYGISAPVKLNLMIKCIQIPAYIINFVIGLIGLLMSIWGIGIIGLMIIIDLCTILLTGTNNIGTCVNLYRNKILTKKEELLFLLLSYIYVLDVIVAFYLIFKVKKNKLINSEDMQNE